MHTSKSLLLTAVSAVLILSSCKKDTKEPETTTPATSVTPAYSVPSTYTFTNTDFVSSTQRLNMLAEMTTYIRSTHTSTAATQPTLDAQQLSDMYSNVNSRFSDATLNTSGVQLKDKTSNDFGLQANMESVFIQAKDASIFSAATPTTNSAAKGTAGKIISPSRAILVDANGFEYKELVEKGVMGGVLYYQATTILKNINNYDNATAVNGITAQEKAWDEAFGYFGVPVAFPTSTVGLKNWGSYANSVDAAIACNATIMNAFLKGRAAISNKDKDGRDAAAKVVMNTWEKIAAAKCINYLKTAKTNFGVDQGTFLHTLTEGYGFVTSFKYNSSRIMSDTDLAALTGYFGSNLYDMTTTNIDNAISKLASIYGIDSSKL